MAKYAMRIIETLSRTVIVDADDLRTILSDFLPEQSARKFGGGLIRFIQELFAEKGRKPNDFELAESTGEKVKNIQDYRIYFNSLVSMDAPVAGDQDLDYSEVLSDPQALSVEEEVEKEELSELISKLMEHLTPKEKYVITKRFGLDGGKPQTYLEISKGIKVSREYVRQLKNRAIEKMKNSRNKLPLEEYWA